MWIFYKLYVLHNDASSEVFRHMLPVIQTATVIQYVNYTSWVAYCDIKQCNICSDV